MADRAGGQRLDVTARIFLFLLLVACQLSLSGGSPRPSHLNFIPSATRVALLDLGTSETARKVGVLLEHALKSDSSISLVDRELAMAAARGVGYGGSLNMSLDEARNLGTAVGCDFFIVGDAQTIRRSASDRPVYFETYSSLFLVSTRDGHLMQWFRPRSERLSHEASEESLLSELEVQAPSYISEIKQAAASLQAVKLKAQTEGAVLFEPAPDDEKTATEKGIRLPQPYRRIRPDYPRSAAEADAEGTVDVLVDIDASGEVAAVDVVRWAGFGLDEAAVQTIRRLHFRPATIKNSPTSIRIMLRYNFRRPVNK